MGGLTVRGGIGAGEAVADTEPTLLKMLLANLVNNGMEANPEEFHVEVKDAPGAVLIEFVTPNRTIAHPGRILRVLQERTVARVGDTRETSIDVRFVFATHRNLGEMAAQGKFREDLYFRLSTFVVNVPPLRERLEDIDILAPHFLQLFLAGSNLANKLLTSDALARLREYDYPGNVRELAKVVKNAAFFSP